MSFHFLKGPFEYSSTLKQCATCPSFPSRNLACSFKIPSLRGVCGACGGQLVACDLENLRLVGHVKIVEDVLVHLGISRTGIHRIPGSAVDLGGLLHIGIALMRLNPRWVKRCGGALRLVLVATVLGYSRLGLRQRSKARCGNARRLRQRSKALGCLPLSAEILVLVLSSSFFSSGSSSEPTCSRQSERLPPDSFFASADAPKRESQPSFDPRSSALLAKRLETPSQAPFHLTS